MSNCSTGFDAKYLLLVLYLVGVNVTAVFMSDRMIRLKLTSLFCSLIMRCLAFVKKKKKSSLLLLKDEEDVSRSCSA